MAFGRAWRPVEKMLTAWTRSPDGLCTWSRGNAGRHSGGDAVITWRLLNTLPIPLMAGCGRRHPSTRLPNPRGVFASAFMVYTAENLLASPGGGMVEGLTENPAAQAPDFSHPLGLRRTSRAESGSRHISRQRPPQARHPPQQGPWFRVSWNVSTDRTTVPV
jgi:hypothetical protein